MHSPSGFSPTAFLVDLRHALRILLREPVFSLTAALILALGVGATTTMFSIVDPIMAPPPLADVDRLVSLDRADPPSGRESLNIPRGWIADLRDEQRSMEGVEAYRTFSVQVAGGESVEPFRLYGAAVTPGLFPLLRVAPIRGRGFSEEDSREGAPPVVLISGGLWRDQFGEDPSILGTVLRVNEIQRTVVGIIPPEFEFPNNQRVWIPLIIQVGVEEGQPVDVIGRLRDGVSLEEARTELSGIGKRMVLADPESSETTVLTVQSFGDSLLNREGRVMLWVMLLAVSFVLLIAAANVANLLLSRAVVRSKQVAIRMALGGGRARVILLLLMEAMTLAAVGGMGGLLFSWLGVGWFDRILGPEVGAWWITFSVNRRALAFTGACVLAATFLAGIIPALQASGVHLQEAMKSESAGTTSFRQGRISGLLVVGQLSLSCALLLLSGLMVLGVIRMDARDPAFQPEGVTVARVGLQSFDYPDEDARWRFAQELETRLRGTPGVEDVTLASYLAGMEVGSIFYSLDSDAIPEGQTRPTAEFNRVTPGFFDFYRMDLAQGRIFEMRDRGQGERVAVVNEEMARRLDPDGSVLGRLLFLGRNPDPDAGVRIVGVVQNSGVSVREGEPYAGIFFPLWESTSGALRISLRSSGETGAIVPALRSTVAELDSNLPLYGVSTLNDELAQMHVAERTFGILFGVFGLCALVLAVVGLYGVIAFSVNRRARELGVRVALGASSRTVLWTTFRRGLLPLGLGLVLGMGLGWLLAPALGEALFGSDPQDPLVFTLVPLTLALAAGMGLWIPSRRASRADPMTVLRTE